MGDLSNFDLLKRWVSYKCILLVREITFENAEEITEEGIPFLLLFYHPDDKSSIEWYKVVVSKLLKREKGTVAEDESKHPNNFFHVAALIYRY